MAHRRIEPVRSCNYPGVVDSENADSRVYLGAKRVDLPDYDPALDQRLRGREPRASRARARRGNPHIPAENI